MPRRVWIDTDATCGHGRRTDPDDCFALLLLTKSPLIDIVGVSTVFGNAPLDATHATIRDLVAALSAEGVHVPPVYRGCAGRAADLQQRVGRLVAVMGRRPGHIFHPAEGKDGGILFGHGPVFRDFNFDQDRTAAAAVLAMTPPTTLIPYKAARTVSVTDEDLAT